MPSPQFGGEAESGPQALTAGPLSPESETSAYRAEVMDEDLRSPCTEEVAVFRTFVRTVAEGKNGFVVRDAAEAYHREVLRQSSNSAKSARRVLIAAGFLLISL